MPKRLFTFHVPRLNDAESGPLLPPQGNETKVSSRSAVGTPSTEGFPAPHSSGDRQAAQQSVTGLGLCPVQPLPVPEPVPAALSVPAHVHQQHSLTQVNSAKNLQKTQGLILPHQHTLGKQIAFYILCMYQ